MASMTAFDPQSVTYDMARFALGLNWENLPDVVRREAPRAWMNWVACAVGAARTPVMDAALRGVQSMESAGDAGLLGRGETTSVSNAALLNCLSSSAQTYDDTHLATITHPTGPVAAAALAVACKQATTGVTVPGRDLLVALVAGLELECRVSCAIAAGGSRQGWYMTGLSGGIGAAAAAGLLLGLDHERLVWALGLAATQAGGLRATHGSMAITYVPGMAARNGVAAAYMALAGFDCGSIALDGRNGLLQVLTGATDAGPIRAELGTRYEFLNNTYKPYPCGIVIHPAIDACLDLARGQGVEAEDIDRVDMRVHPDALNLCWRKLPDNVMDAQVSLFHWTAAVLVSRAAGLAQGEIACVLDPRVRALQERMHAEAVAAMSDNEAEVSVRLKSGRVMASHIRNATGSVTNPMTDEQLIEKFRGLVSPVLGEAGSQRLLQACLDVEATKDVSAIVALSR
jgi:2-methylcitrate dehydratase PrpD